MKNFRLIVTMMAFFAVLTLSASAQTKEVNDAATVAGNATKTWHSNYVDSDNDGVCDNYSTNHKDGHGVNFVDSDNDGVCDNHATHQHRGHGKGHGHNHKNGHGYGYGNGHGHGHGDGHGYFHRHGNDE